MMTYIGYIQLTKIGVVIIKNPANTVMSEIENWMNNHGYPYRHLYVVDDAVLETSTRISQEVIEEFENEFGEKLILKGASYGSDGSIEEFKYYCDHSLLREFKKHLHSWLNDHDFQFHNTTLTSSIIIYCSDEMSDSFIHQFEEEFGARCRGYTVSCNSNNRYEFR